MFEPELEVEIRTSDGQSWGCSVPAGLLGLIILSIFAVFMAGGC